MYHTLMEQKMSILSLFFHSTR